jgi:hypothetical protein
MGKVNLLRSLANKYIYTLHGTERQVFRRSSADTLAACMFPLTRRLLSQQEDQPFIRNKQLDFSMIHESSFCIFKGAFVQEISGVYDGAWRSIFNSNSTSIFNEEGNKRQRNKRVQCKFSLFEVPSENTTVNVALRSIYRRLQELLPRHHSEVWTLILSKSGTSLQDPHCDYTICPAEEQRRQQEGYQLETTSFSLLIPTSDGANFVVWDAKEGNNEAKVIVIQKGDALILRDDCIHSGGYYKYEHFARLHVYLTCQSVPSIGTDTNIVKGLLSLEKKRQLEREIKQKLGW